ncbi:unnamed protein product [Laminaria digitata]
MINSRIRYRMIRSTAESAHGRTISLVFYGPGLRRGLAGLPLEDHTPVLGTLLTLILSSVSPKRDCGPKGVKLCFYQSAEGLKTKKQKNEEEVCCCCCCCWRRRQLLALQLRGTIVNTGK